MLCPGYGGVEAAGEQAAMRTAFYPVNALGPSTWVQAAGALL